MKYALTLFEKNMEFQQGLFKSEDDRVKFNLPDPIDLSHLAPEMITEIIPEIDTKCVLFHLDDINEMIPGINLQLVDIGVYADGSYDLDCYYQASEEPDFDPFIELDSMKYNIILPKWMIYKARQMFRDGDAV